MTSTTSVAFKLFLGSTRNSAPVKNIPFFPQQWTHPNLLITARFLLGISHLLNYCSKLLDTTSKQSPVWLKLSKTDFLCVQHLGFEMCIRIGISQYVWTSNEYGDMKIYPSITNTQTTTYVKPSYVIKTERLFRVFSLK